MDNQLDTQLQSDLKNCAICENRLHVREHLFVRRPEGGDEELLLQCEKCALVYVNESIRVNRGYKQVEGSSWQKQFPDEVDVYSESSWSARHQDTSRVIAAQFESASSFIGRDLSTDGFMLVEVGCPY